MQKQTQEQVDRITKLPTLEESGFFNTNPAKSQVNKLSKMMNETVFLNEPEIKIDPIKQYDEDLREISKWIVAHKDEITSILAEIK